MVIPSIPLEDRDAWYQVFEAKDPAEDGHALAAVSSTRIYCRPVCRYHASSANITFFSHPAQAEAAGYRPCYVCRPEIAPGLSPALVQTDRGLQAAALLRSLCSNRNALTAAAGMMSPIDDPVFNDSSTNDPVAALDEAICGTLQVSATDYLQTCRLHLAKALLTDTTLPLEDIATACGFVGADELRDVFSACYRRDASDLQSKTRPILAREDGAFVTLLGYRPPYEFGKLLNFFRYRTLAGVEVVDETSYARTVRMTTPNGEVVTGWIRVEDFPRKNCLRLEASLTLLPVLSQVIDAVRRQFDLDADPDTLYNALRPLEALNPRANVRGTRLPGAFDGFEIACRAVLGQQVSVLAANKMAARVVEAYGTPVTTSVPGLTYAFPTATEIAALDPIEEALGPLGIIKTRARAISQIATQVVAGTLRFDRAADVAEQKERLLAVKGIGPWSANYIALRTLNDPDAFLESDAGIRHALPELDEKQRRAAAEPLSPWRSYAVIGLWNSLSAN